MENKELYENVNNKIKKMDKNELIDFINNLLRKIPQNKYDEVINMLEVKNTDEGKIKEKILEYKNFFKKIKKSQIYFYESQYEDYSMGWEEWNSEFSDKYNIGKTLNNAFDYAVNLVNCRLYDYAKEILEILVDTEYSAYDTDLDDYSYLMLTDLESYDLISFSSNIVCLYLIYIILKTSDNKVEEIYKYLKYNINFRYVSIKNSFNLGVEQLNNIDEFMQQWIEFLSKKNGIEEYRWLKEVLEYSDFKYYKDNIEDIIKNQPKIIIEIFNHLKINDEIEEIIQLGNKTLEKTKNNSIDVSNVAIYLASLNTKRQEEYLVKSFMLNANAINLIRIVVNGYFYNNKKEIYRKIEIEKNLGNLDEKKYFMLEFFYGNFEIFYNESIKHKELLGWTFSFEKVSTYLWLLLLYDGNEKTKSYMSILNEIFEDIGYDKDETLFFGDDIDKIWKSWKKSFKIEEKLKNKVLKWLENIIYARVEAILKGNYRKSYYKIATLIVFYAEMKQSQGIESKKDVISDFINKYPRRTALKREIEELL